MHRPYDFARIIGLLLLAALLQGCSAIRLGYNSVDSLAYYWLDGYVDFTDAQQPLVREQLTRVHLWHRTAELPRIADLLQRAAAIAPTDVTPAQVCTLAGEARASLMRLSEQSEPAIAALGPDMSAEQLRYLERKQARKNADFRKDWLALSLRERTDKRLKQMLERSEDFYGRLDDTQRALMRQQLEQSTFDPARADAETRRRQQDTVQTLRRLASAPVPPAQARGVVRPYLERMVVSPDPAHRAYQEAQLQEFCNNFALIHNSTTPKQRESAVKRLAGYERDLRELATQK